LTIYLAEIPYRSTSSSGLPLRGISRTARRSTVNPADATAALTRLDVAAWRPELSGALAALRKPDSGTDLPPGYGPRARRLFARACVLDRVLALANEVAPGGAVNGYEAQQRDAALRPLMVACRRAMVAACNSPLEP